jgi:hypothetical protein
MNKIVRAHYPVELLPNDLRELAGAARTVTVTIETEGSHPVLQSTAEILAVMKESRDSLPVSHEDDPVGRIRKLRDEWED